MAHNQEQIKKKLVKKLQDVRMVQVACHYVGVSRATFYRWRSEDPAFAAQCEEAIQLATDMISDLAESHIVAGVKNGDIGLAKYWLQHHHPSYKPAEKVQQKQEEVNPFAKFRPDQLRYLIEIGEPGFETNQRDTMPTDDDTAE